MSLPVILRAEAESDVRQTYHLLGANARRVGRQVPITLRAVLERVERFPELYGVVWQGVRAARLKKFAYIVYYLVFPDRVEVLAVLHGARDESTWQSRIQP